VKSIFGSPLLDLELEPGEIAERNGRVVGHERTVAPFLDGADDGVVQLPIRALDDRNALDGAGARYADLRLDDVLGAAAVERRRDLGVLPGRPLQVAHVGRQELRGDRRALAADDSAGRASQLAADLSAHGSPDDAALHAAFGRVVVLVVLLVVVL